MSTVEEIPENKKTKPHSVPETTKDTKAIVDEHPSTNQTKPDIPSISQSEEESANLSSTQKQDSHKITPQNEPSSTPEITKEEKTLPNEPSQNQITTEMAKIPESKSDSATVDEQPPTNQTKASNISSEKPSTETLKQDPQNIPPQNDKEVSQNITPQTEPSSSPEITEEEKTLPNEPSQAQITTEMANKNPKTKPHPIETLKPDSAIVDEQPSTKTLKQDPQNIPPQNDKKVSQNITPQTDPSSTPEITEERKTLPNEPSQAKITTEMANKTPKIKPDPVETLKPDSANVDEQPSTQTLKQDPQNITPQNDKEASKKVSTCLPLPDLLHRSKDHKRLEMEKNPVLVQEKPIIPTKNELPKEPTSAYLSSKDEITKSIDADIKYILEESSRLSKYKDHVILQLKYAEERFENLKKVGTAKELRELKKEITKLKLQIPSKNKGGAEERDPHRREQENGFSRKKNIPELVMKQMPELHKSHRFECSPEVMDFEARYAKMSTELKLCLLCFSIFPENAVIKKRLMVYWWIAEGFVSDEDSAGDFFNQLTEMGFIEPVDRKRNLSVGCFTMHPFVRLALVKMAVKEKFFNFDEEGMASEKSEGTFQTCLMGKGLIETQDPEKLHAVFNINEPILDFLPDWFSRMKNINVLYLGRWKVSATHHIEIEEMNFLDGLSSMDHLRFFSLQGVSRIMELPDSITELSDLVILDLRACHSLESIPEGIGFLKNLTFLDFSECYLLEHMPKGLSLLSNLKVFKGFVVSENPNRHTCSLEDLAKLEKLIKLCIYTGLIQFPEDKDLKALQSFKALKKLTIAWGAESLHLQPPSSEGSEHKKKALAKSATLGKTLKRIGTFKGRASGAARPLELKKLEKLDLKSFPRAASPTWLMPSSLRSLKKLYIRGGKFSDLGQFEDDLGKGTWGVEILRLKYLSDLEMDWRQLKELFPNLVYLEKVNCPKLSFFPSDGYGVWINKEKLKQMKTRS